MRNVVSTLGVCMLAALAVGCADGGNDDPGAASGTTSTTGSGGAGGQGGGGAGGGGAGGGGDTGGGGSGGGALSDPATGAWRTGFGVPGLGGFGARAEAIVRAPDGKLYVGGIFKDAAGTPANNVAVYDGTQWQALGNGLPGWVKALALDTDGTLYAGGSFGTENDPNHLARWDGQSWTMLPGDLDGDVDTLAIQGSRVLVGGAFTHAGGVDTASIAAWDGADWTAIGTTGADFDVKAILVQDATSFCIGGGFGTVDLVPAANVACWDGDAWSQLGDGLPGEVSRLAIGPDQRVYAGGTLTFTTDPNLGLFEAGIAVLNGATWEPFHGGIDDGFINEVRAVAFAGDGDVLLGGTFNSAGNPKVGAQNLARFDTDTQTWAGIGGGVVNEVGVALGSVVGVSDLLVAPDGGLFAGGLFSTGGAGQVQAANIAQWKNAKWSPLVNVGMRYDAVGGLINAMDADAKGRVVAGGAFATAGGLRVGNVARFGPGGWEMLGSGVDDTVREVLVRADGSILVGGDFVHAGGVTTPFLAQWKADTWTSFAAPLDGPVMALVEDANGVLYAGGDFVTAGGTTVNRVARWDGSQWSALGEGFDQRVTSLALDAAGHLVATGLFHQQGKTTMNGIASWDGSKWISFGTGLDGDWAYGSRVVTSGDGFVVSGAFSGVDGHPLPAIARWDGQQWSGPGEGLSGQLGGETIVSDIAPYGDGLFATGTFESAGDTKLSYIGWWDGNAWHPLGTGLGDLGESLLVVGPSLFVGGGFVEVGGTVSTGIAAWDFAD